MYIPDAAQCYILDYFAAEPPGPHNQHFKYLKGAHHSRVPVLLEGLAGKWGGLLQIGPQVGEQLVKWVLAGQGLDAGSLGHVLDILYSFMASIGKSEVILFMTISLWLLLVLLLGYLLLALRWLLSCDLALDCRLGL